DSRQLFEAAGIYLLIALVIWKLYPKVNGFMKELLFFSLLALTVTSSVQLAGVLVVFSLLIAPALIAQAQKRLPPMIAASIFGWIVTTLTIIISFFMDLPTGYAIVFVLALTTLLILLIFASKKI
ncbi:MAG: metal ABC transporter permease, partial [Thiovulaceae bacterium]|nr:metal ABC transporter permease [Sulfurimonadaceae bacterium]